MATLVPLNWGRIVLSGVLAGIAGAVTLNVFLLLVSLLPIHMSILSLWQFAASAAFGKAAYASDSFIWIGLGLILLAAIGWGIGYSYMAHTRPVLNKQPLISGFIFGIIIYVIMEFVLFSVQALKVPEILTVYIGVFASTVFFGIPVALVARMK